MTGPAQAGSVITQALLRQVRANQAEGSSQMKRGIAVAAVVAAAIAAALAGAHVGGGSTQAAAADNGCQLNSKQIKHVIYLQFDNTHYNRDNPNVASDLQKMPHL